MYEFCLLTSLLFICLNQLIESVHFRHQKFKKKSSHTAYQNINKTGRLRTKASDKKKSVNVCPPKKMNTLWKRSGDTQKNLRELTLKEERRFLFGNFIHEGKHIF